jgi:murein DD-endopeptidase MepM/ murein hydrolase activator NlpD
MLKVIAPERGTDAGGSGHYGASRGTRRHNGQDFNVAPGSTVLSPVDGFITKLGYPYGDDLTYRYVQVQDDQGNRHRFFYVEPVVEIQDYIQVGEVLGTAQNVARRYPVPKGMAPHVHYEIIDKDGIYINPVK